MQQKGGRESGRVQQSLEGWCFYVQVRGRNGGK